jgi:hypothetical protein
VVDVTSTIPSLRRINTNLKYSKNIHLFMEMNKHIIKKLVYTRASMLVIVANVVRKLGIMHLVIKSKSLK